MIRCLITDGSSSVDEARWRAKLAHWLSRGVELVQIRERHLEARELARLTRKVLALPNPSGTKIIVNDRADVAIATGAHGVHLREGSPAPRLFARPGFLVTAVCHNPERIAELEGADFILLAPVFKPISKPGTAITLGLEGIRRACAGTKTPVLALGGVTGANVDECLRAGAAGYAGISGFGAPADLPASA